MKYPFNVSLLFLILSTHVFSQDEIKLDSILNGLKIELVQPGTVSTNGFEFGTSISPNGKELFFIKGLVGFRRTVLVYCHWKNGYWSKPQIAPFSGEPSDMNPYHSKDGKRLYFTSNRPTKNPLLKNSNIWYVDRIEDGWSEPKLVKGLINDGYEIVYPTVHSDGTIHFVSWSRPGSENGDIFISKLENGKYSAPERVDELNTIASDADPEMSLNGKYMFLTSQREGGLGHYDLYIFSKKTDGKWGKGINLGSKVNSSSMDSDPILSPDGLTLYFSSNRLNQLDSKGKKFTDYEMLLKNYDQIHNGLMNIYKVDIRTLLKYLEKIKN
jgi:Tol biopolymer transport system component